MCQQSLVGSISKAFIKATIEWAKLLSSVCLSWVVVPSTWCTKHSFGCGCVVYLLVTRVRKQQEFQTPCLVFVALAVANCSHRLVFCWKMFGALLQWQTLVIRGVGFGYCLRPVRLNNMQPSPIGQN